MSNKETKKRSPEVLLTNVRLSYPKLAVPEAVKSEPDGRKRYGAVLMIPKSDKANHAKAIEAVNQVKEMYPNVTFKKKDLLLKDGDTDEDADENYKGHWFLSANRSETQKAPAVVDRKRNPLKPEDDKFPYAGCWVNAKIGVYKPKGWDKVCASLEVVQFWRDDEPFGSGRASLDDLPEGEDEDDDEGLGDDD